jgi:hypothetical protein
VIELLHPRKCKCTPEGDMTQGMLSKVITLIPPLVVNGIPKRDKDRVMKKFSSSSYEEFVHEFSLSVPDNFNFAFDVLDSIADEDPDRLAMVHVDDAGDCKRY